MITKQSNERAGTPWYHGAPRAPWASQERRKRERMPGVVVLESMWNKKGRLLDDEPWVLPYLKAIRQSLAWEGIRVNLVYRRFYSSYDLGLLMEEVRRRRSSIQVCSIDSQHPHR